MPNGAGLMTASMLLFEVLVADRFCEEVLVARGCCEELSAGSSGTPRIPVAEYEACEDENAGSLGRGSRVEMRSVGQRADYVWSLRDA